MIGLVEIRKISFFLALSFVFSVFVSVFLYAQPPVSPDSPPAVENTGKAVNDTVTVTIIYDDNPGRTDMRRTKGFSCVIQGLEKTILFDTGWDSEVFLDNLEKSGISLEDIDVVVLSHAHGDHIGGLPGVLDKRKGLTVYIPSGFPEVIKERLSLQGAHLVQLSETYQICPGAITTGTMEGDRIKINEHGLCIKTPRGWLLISGCGHPGIDRMAKISRELLGEPLYMVMGGFHMGDYSPQQIEDTIDVLESTGAQCVVPCHCTGDRARRIFKEYFGDKCTLAGVGSVIEFKQESDFPESQKE